MKKKSKIMTEKANLDTRFGLFLGIVFGAVTSIL